MEIKYLFKAISRKVKILELMQPQVEMLTFFTSNLKSKCNENCNEIIKILYKLYQTALVLAYKFDAVE